jgi:hypothetical protein
MARKVARYSELRKRMQPGDIIAFSGKGQFSEIIKWATRSAVSHVGIVLQSKLLIGDTPQDGFFNQIIESTSLNGFSGVSISRLSDRVDTYDGEMWWLPLSEKSRNTLQTKQFYDFLLHQEKKPYDTPQAVKSALDALDDIPLLRKATHNIEDFSSFFCSELAAAALEVGEVVSNINASEVTPIDLCMFSIYHDDYYQIKGKGKEKDIKGYNTLPAEGWGV